MAHSIRGMSRPQMIRVIQKQTGNLVTADRMCVFRHVPQLSHFPLLRRIIKKTLIETAIIKPDRSILTLEDGSHLAFSRRFQILRPVKEMLTSQGKPVHPANQACPPYYVRSRNHHHRSPRIDIPEYPHARQIERFLALPYQPNEKPLHVPYLTTYNQTGRYRSH